MHKVNSIMLMKISEEFWVSPHVKMANQCDVLFQFDLNEYTVRSARDKGNKSDQSVNG